MFTVEYSNHDQGAKGGKMVRRCLEAAKRTADLMGGCGYRKVTIYVTPGPHRDGR